MVLWLIIVLWLFQIHQLGNIYVLKHKTLDANHRSKRNANNLINDLQNDENVSTIKFYAIRTVNSILLAIY